MNLIRNMVRASALTAIALGVVSFANGQTQSPTQPQTRPGTGQVNPMMGGGITQTPWFSNQQVRQQLNLNENQFTGLNKAYQQAYNTYQQGVNGLDKTLNDTQRQQRMNELQGTFYKDLTNSTNTVLTDPKQLERYNQLYWQYQGYGAFTNPTIAEMLKLTPEQRDRFRQMQQDWSTQMSKLGPLYQTDKQQAITQFSKLQGQNTDRINSVLTPEQQKMWQQLAGNSYVFPPEVYFDSMIPPSSKK